MPGLSALQSVSSWSIGQFLVTNRGTMRALPAVVARTVVLAIIVVLGACSSGGSSKTTPRTTSAGGSTSVASAPQGSPVAVVLKDSHGVSGSMTMIVSPNGVRTGAATFTVRNEGTIQHEFVVVKTERALTLGANGRVGERGAVGALRAIAPGETKSITLHLKVGKYELVCNLKDHYGRGMHVPFTVR
jgi:uncharacterized cupredoxin-like copper-binding protein